jgi:hypothetical protein
MVRHWQIAVDVRVKTDKTFKRQCSYSCVRPPGRPSDLGGAAAFAICYLLFAILKANTPGRRVFPNVLPGHIFRHRIALEQVEPNATPLIVGPKLFINLGPKPLKEALERERPQIVNNFAPRRVSRHELTPPSTKEEYSESFERLNGLECKTILRP